MKKVLSIILSAALLLCASPMVSLTALTGLFTVPARAAEIVHSGNCGVVDPDNGLNGGNATWTLDSDGLLTISGTGTACWCEAWYDCRDSITALRIEEGVTAVYADFGFWTFDLYSVSVADSVKDIDHRFFEYTPWYDALPEGPIYFGHNLYSYKAEQAVGGAFAVADGTTCILDGFMIAASSLDFTEISIPATVEDVGDAPFEEWKALQRITVDSANPYYCSDDSGALYNKDKTVLLRYPAANPADSYDLPDMTERIGTEAFAYTIHLRSCGLPSSLREIGDGAFMVSGIQTVDFPEGLKKIGELAFYACTNIKFLRLPESLTELGDSAFAFMDFQELHLPAGFQIELTGQASNPVFMTHSLQTITVAQDNPAYTVADNVLYTKDMHTLVLYPMGKQSARYVIPEDVETIGSFALCNYALSLDYDAASFEELANSEWEGIPDSALKTVILPKRLHSIQDYAFFGCNGLTDVDIPDGVTFIGESAFDSCSSLTGMVIPGSVTAIGDYAFDDCAALTTIVIPPETVSIGIEAVPTHTVILGTSGSEAEEWANENGCAFIPQSDAVVILNAPKTVNTASVDVYGVATPGASVVLTVNGADAETVKASACGKWNAALTLPAPHDGDTFTVKASVTVSGETVQTSANVTYRPNAVVFRSLTMTHNYSTETINAAALGKARRNFTFVPGRSFSFQVSVTNSQEVEKLYVTSTKTEDEEEETKRMALTYDAESDCWFGTGFFDEDDPGYVPGELDVTGELKEGGEFDTDIDVEINFLVDPSGYVYEAVRSNVLEDATASVFYRDADGHEILWNADAYDQLNPINTFADGAFAWVVPEGWWQVRVSKDGYEDAVSEWMEVPPERTNVYIPMVSSLSPEVALAAVYTDYADITFTQYMDIDSVSAQTVTVEGRTGTVAPVDATETYTGSGVFYAKTFRYTPTVSFARSVNLTVEGAVNYAGTEMEQPFTAHVNTGLEPANLKSNAEVSVEYGKTAVVTVTAQHAAGRAVAVSANSANVTLSAKTLTLDENGTATLTVTGVMPGDATITFAMEGTDLTARTAATVTSPAEVSEPDTEPTEPSSEPATEPVTEEPSTEEPATGTPGEPAGEECPYCHKVHKNDFFGKLTAFFHRIIYRFTQLFKK